MGRKSQTQQLIEDSLGQHLALSVAAHLARTQLVPDPLAVYDGQHMSEMLDVVANALAKAAPVYVHDAKSGALRELGTDELEGASVRRGATVLILKDGRQLSSVSMKRADLRQAIAILKTTGIPELPRAPQNESSPPKAAAVPLREQLSELEKLLREPLIELHVQKANHLAVAIARHTRHGHVANLAMQLVSAVHEARGEAEPQTQRVSVALARLRSAVQELDENP